MERARQMLCSELRGELQLIYILCHAGEDKMFLYIKSNRGDLFTYEMEEKRGGAEEVAQRAAPVGNQCYAMMCWEGRG